LRIAVGWAKALLRRAHHLAHHSEWWARFRLRSVSYVGQVALPTLRLLLVHWTSKGTTKALRFAPRLTNLFRKTGELGCYLYDDECDHGYRPALTSKRLI
jgi:hypothetical protein